MGLMQTIGRWLGVTKHSAPAEDPAPAPAAERPARKPSPVDEIIARRQEREAEKLRR